MFWWLIIRPIAAMCCLPYAFDHWMHFFGKPYTMPVIAAALIGVVPLIGKVRVSLALYFLTVVIFTWVLV